MSKKANTAMIGAFVIGAIILAVVGILAFGSGALFRSTDKFVLYFDGDLKGLTVGAPVLFRGVPVGEVRSIKVFYKSGTSDFVTPVVIETQHERFHEITDDSGEYAENIDRDEIDRLIRDGLRGQLTLQSLVTGQLAISLSMLPDTPANLRHRGKLMEIPTVPSGFERLAQAIDKLDLGKLVDNVNRAMNALEEMIAEGALENLIADIDKAAVEVGSLASELRGHAKVATDEFQMTAQSARGLMGTVENQVDPVANEAVQTLEEIQQAMAQAEKTLVTIDELAADYTEESAFNFQLTTALEEFSATMRSVRALTDMLQQQPDALLRGRTSGGN